MRKSLPIPILLVFVLAAACSDDTAPSSGHDAATDTLGDMEQDTGRAEGTAHPDAQRDANRPDGAMKGGWGAKCSFDSDCQASFNCKSGKTDLYGFCTKSCSPAGSLCTYPDLPSGTVSYCALAVAGTYYCGFLCKLGTQTYPCPAGMVCGTQETPPGSKQYWCLSQ